MVRALLRALLSSLPRPSRTLTGSTRKSAAHSGELWHGRRVVRAVVSAAAAAGGAFGALTAVACASEHAFGLSTLGNAPLSALADAFTGDVRFGEELLQDAYRQHLGGERVLEHDPDDFAEEGTATEDAKERAEPTVAQSQEPIEEDVTDDAVLSDSARPRERSRAGYPDGQATRARDRQRGVELLWKLSVLPFEDRAGKLKCLLAIARGSQDAEVAEVMYCAGALDILVPILRMGDPVLRDLVFYTLGQLSAAPSARRTVERFASALDGATLVALARVKEANRALFHPGAHVPAHRTDARVLPSPDDRAAHARAGAHSPNNNASAPVPHVETDRTEDKASVAEVVERTGGSALNARDPVAEGVHSPHDVAIPGAEPGTKLAIHLEERDAPPFPEADAFRALLVVCDTEGDPCLRHFMSLALFKIVSGQIAKNAAKKEGEFRFLATPEDVISVVASPAPEKNLKLPKGAFVTYCLKALGRLSLLPQNQTALVHAGALETLLAVARQPKPDLLEVREVARIVANLSSNPSLWVAMVTSGWLTQLRDWAHESNDVALEGHASRALANLDHAANGCADYYPDGVFLLHPEARVLPQEDAEERVLACLRSGRRDCDKELSPSMDVVFVHGLLGGPFFTFRQEPAQGAQGNKWR
eukprot:Opistho-1_new@39753